jgi:hypothetical protein
MSVMGQRRRPMSALPPKADIAKRDRRVRFVAKADSCTATKIAAVAHALPQIKHQVSARPALPPPLRLGRL